MNPRRDTSAGRTRWAALGSAATYWLWRRWQRGGSEEQAVANESLERGHEPEASVGVGGIVAFAVILLVTIGLSMAVLASFYKILSEGDAATEAGPSPFASYRAVPPPPRLQQETSIDLRELHRVENELLHTYGWADRVEERVHIPIERAMDLIAERGLPVQDTTAADSALVLSESGFVMVRRRPPPPTAPAYLGSSPEPYVPSPDVLREPGSQLEDWMRRELDSIGVVE